MTTIIKARDAGAFLSVLPHMLRCTPQRSVVIVPFTGSRSLGAMRVDLPAEDAEIDAVAATLIGMVCRVDGSEAYAVVVYDDAPAAGPPHTALVAALEVRAHACGLRRVDALHVAGARWRSYLDDGAGGDLPPAPALDAPGIEPPHADQHSGAALPAADLAARERVGRAIDEIEHAMDWLRTGTAVGDRRIHPSALVAIDDLEDLPGFFDARLDPVDPDAPPDAWAMAGLLWCLANPALRDVGLSTWVRGVDAGDAAVIAQRRWERGEDYPAEAAEWMLGEGPRPDADRLEAALALCRTAAAVAPRTHRPGPLAAAAWLAWALGRSTHAGFYCESALEIEPEHGLSGIVLSMVAASHLPDWAFRPDLGRGGRVT